MFLEKQSNKDINKEVFRPKMLGNFSQSLNGNYVLHSENPDAVEIDF